MILSKIQMEEIYIHIYFESESFILADALKTLFEIYSE